MKRGIILTAKYTKEIHAKVAMNFLSILCAFFVLLVANSTPVVAQNTYFEAEKKLKDLATTLPALNDTISMSVSDWPLQEFLRGIANYSKLNFDIASDIDNKITVNFSRVKAVDVLVYVCKQYKLDISIQGAIISISKTPPVLPDESKEVIFNVPLNTLSIDVKQKKLSEVIRKITTASGRNIVPEPGIEDTPITAFIQDLPFQSALDKLAFANNMDINISKDSVFVISRNIPKETPQNIGGPGDGNRRTRKQEDQKSSDYSLTINSYGRDSLIVNARYAPVEQIITESCQKLGKSYFLTTKIEGNKTFDTKAKPFDLFMSELLNATDYTYVNRSGTYFFGNRNQNDMKYSKVIMLQNRTVKKLNEILPKSITADLEITEFAEQNSIVISGTYDKVENTEQFITAIDKPVPVILIEVIIIDMKKSYTISTGIEAGKSNEQIKTEGVIFPGFDVTLSSESINRILKDFKGFEAKNIGVKPNIYLSLKAMEDQGIIKIRSTPKLSTLNGHEAKLVIGRTEYYLEESSNVIGSLGTQMSTNQNYKPVDAEFAITITPIVSGSNKITLDIEVKQSDFTTRITPTAPPGIVKREFKSLIKVQNQETIILGGLEEIRNSDSANGVPLLSRIPVIKWLFSSRKKLDSNSKLNVFIKPTIID